MWFPAPIISITRIQLFAVIPSYKEPIEGWTDNINGPLKIVVWTVRGYVHCIHGDPNIPSNMIPVDYCTNSMLAVAWDISKRQVTVTL